MEGTAREEVKLKILRGKKRLGTQPRETMTKKHHTENNAFQATDSKQ